MRRQEMIVTCGRMESRRGDAAPGNRCIDRLGSEHIGIQAASDVFLGGEGAGTILAQCNIINACHARGPGCRDQRGGGVDRELIRAAPHARVDLLHAGQGLSEHGMIQMARVGQQQRCGAGVVSQRLIERSLCLWAELAIDDQMVVALERRRCEPRMRARFAINRERPIVFVVVAELVELALQLADPFAAHRLVESRPRLRPRFAVDGEVVVILECSQRKKRGRAELAVDCQGVPVLLR